MIKKCFSVNPESKARVMYLLKNYADMERRQTVLQQKIADFTSVSCDHVIEMLTFEKKLSDKVMTSNVANPTQTVALKYQAVADSLNIEALTEMLSDLKSVTCELNMLRFCIDQLSGKLSDFVTDLCIRDKSREDLCEKYFITPPTLSKWLNRAAEEIVWLQEGGRDR